MVPWGVRMYRGDRDMSAIRSTGALRTEAHSKVSDVEGEREGKIINGRVGLHEQVKGGAPGGLV